MAIDKIFNDANVDGIADNIFGAVNNSVSEVKQMQQRKAAENVQMVVEAFKKIETNITEKFDNVTDVIEKRVLTIKDGRDGSSGSDGRNGRDGKPGRDGVNGKQGPPGTPGKDGVDGVDGVSVTDANIDFDGSLVISLSSGQQINVGEIVPPELERQLVELRQGGSSGSGGDVAGPTSSTDNAIVRFDGTTGKLVQNSVVTIADTTGDMAGVGALTASGNTSLATTPVLYSGDGTVSSGRLLGRYSYRTATPTTAYFYDFNNSNTITSADSLASQKIATLIDSTITNANALTAFGTSYGAKNAGLSFVSGTASDVLLASVGSAPLLNSDINAVVVGYTAVGPRIAIQNYALNDDTANAISYVGAVHRFYPAGTEVAKISSTGLAVTGAATISTTLGVTGATTLSAALTYGGVTLTNAVTGTGKMVLDTSPTLVTPALGTPSSGTVTNLTGTASININGTVGATTPGTGAFTTLSASSTLAVTGVSTFAAGSAALPAITTSGDTNTGIFFPAADTIAFSEGGAEAMRLDSSGNLLVGTTTSSGKLTVSGNFNLGGSSVGNGLIGITGSDSYTFILQGVTSLKAGSNVSSANVTPANPAIIQSQSSNGAGARMLLCKPNASTDGFVISGDSLGTGTTIQLYNSSGTLIFNVANNGNVTNTNNSYGAISDVKLKENIVDTSPKLADLMQVKVRNYNLIGNTKKQIGVIAQELETVFPAVVDETTDYDKSGNDLGTTTKSVKYSVFVPMLIKAIQEQQAIINQLKARLDAANL